MLAMSDLIVFLFLYVELYKTMLFNVGILQTDIIGKKKLLTLLTQKIGLLCLSMSLLFKKSHKIRMLHNYSTDHY